MKNKELTIENQSPGEITQLLQTWQEGDKGALDQLMPLVYRDLRMIAAAYLHGECINHTLAPTALVHDAFLRLIQQQQVHWRNRTQFLATAATLMRRILVDHARTKQYAKRGGPNPTLSLEEWHEKPSFPVTEILELEAVLLRLSELYPELGRLVELRFFGGLTSKEISQVLKISVPTISRKWRIARAWLYREMQMGLHK